MLILTMIIDEINGMLNRQVVFSFSVDLPITDFSMKYNLPMIVRIRITKDGGYALVNMENGPGLDESDLKEISKYDLKRTRDAIMAKIDLTGTKFLSGFIALNAVPSLVVDGVIVHDGYCYIYFRFHENDEQNVTRALRQNFMDFSRYAVQYIGPSTGAIDVFKELSDVTPLKYVEITSSVPPSFMNITNDPVIVNLGVSWTRELKYLLEDEIRAVYYDKHSLLTDRNSFVTEISKKDHIYETSFTNPLIQFFVKQASENFTITLGMPQKLNGKTFSFSTIVPQIVLPDFFETMREAIKQFQEWDIDIHYVRDVEALESP